MTSLQGFDVDEGGCSNVLALECENGIDSLVVGKEEDSIVEPRELLYCVQKEVESPSLARDDP